MQPPIAKRTKIDNPQDADSSTDVQSSYKTTLPTDIIVYLGKFIVKHPALHLFLPASRELAECAKKVFIDFANAGGALNFFSTDPGPAAAFAKKERLRNLNLIKFGEIPEEDCKEFFDEAYQISQLTVQGLPWLSESLPNLPQLTTLQFADHGMEDLSFMTNLQALQVLRLNFRGANSAPLNFVHSLRRLTRLEICNESNIQNVNLPLFNAMSGLVNLKLETLLPKDLPQQLACLPNLKALSLEFCDDETEELPENITATYLGIRACFTNLTKLKLENSSSVAWGFTNILEWLTNLETLRLADVTAEEYPEILETTFRKISGLTNLTVLKMSGLLLNKTLSESIERLGRLRTLELSTGSTTEKISFSFLEALTALQTLDFYGRALTLESFRVIGKLRSLTTLNLADFNLTQAALINLTTLTRLNTLSLEGFTKDESAVSFAPLTNLACLSKIKVRRNAHVSSLPLQAMPYLSRLELTSGAENEDITSIVDYACTLTQLRRLVIRSPQLSVNHIRSISENLIFLEKLTVHSDLFGNDFDTVVLARDILNSKQIRLKRNAFE